MKTVLGIRDLPSQTFNHNINEGTIDLKLEYKPAVSMWFLSVSFLDFEVNGLLIRINPNIMVEYKNIIPFGILIDTKTKSYEPSLIDDFSSGRVTFNILSKEEVDFLENRFIEIRDEVINIEYDE